MKSYDRDGWERTELLKRKDPTARRLQEIVKVESQARVLCSSGPSRELVPRRPQVGIKVPRYLRSLSVGFHIVVLNDVPFLTS